MCFARLVYSKLGVGLGGYDAEIPSRYGAGLNEAPAAAAAASVYETNLCCWFRARLLEARCIKLEG